ncbi:MAG: flagellar biosynthesis protein FlhB [Alphaproteobacteria bacterium]|jgi:flagellar biosynthetic protein FlhB|nr:flagellar biosynthesis protein FlhB [Alphaproteobacteria bacterium]
MAEDGEQPDDTQKTEEPTPKKLEEARKKGQVALSREVNNWVMLLAATILIVSFTGPVFKDITLLMQTYIERSHDIPGAPGGLYIALGEGLKKILLILALPFALLMLAAFLSPFVQVGPLFAPEIIKPDISKISPMKGFQRLFSMRSIMEFVKGILKIVVISIVGAVILYPYFGQLDHMVGLPIPLLMGEMKTLVVRLMVGILVVLLVIAVIDLLYQRYEHYKRMRMTKQELKDEYKQTEGDPHVKARLRQLRTEKARQRMIQAVPRADVVITNPTHYSIALEYKPETMDAPVCIAKGLDNVALRIREVAKEHNIVLFENPPLARVLYDTVDIDETIPSEHFKAVAEVISYVFKLRGKLR